MTGGLVHATAVALGPERGVLILGPSGSGKSVLALRLMAFGATLVSDDQVLLRAEEGTLTARAPDTIRGRIEARGVGILRAEALPAARLVLAVDLGAEAGTRFPGWHEQAFFGVSLPLVRGGHCDHVDVSILQWLKGGRWA